MDRKGFTLVEIMIVVAIIALLAAIAIPNLLRARLAANDALAQSTLRTISTAAETYATANAGTFPSDEDDMTQVTPKYLNKPYCDTTTSGYTYSCYFNQNVGYTVTASPSAYGTSGSSTYTIKTGGIISPE